VFLFEEVVDVELELKMIVVQEQRIQVLLMM
jgi:hypothetical protein